MVCEGLHLRLVAGAVFVLLATALCIRPLLDEWWTVDVLVFMGGKPWWRHSPAMMCLAHLVGAAGLILAGIWIALARRRWRFCGLEIGAVVLVVAAWLSVGAASDKRAAINVAIGTILPLVLGAALFQVLMSWTVWRRALLACLVAMAAAHCWKASAQLGWEYQQEWEQYSAHKNEFWARLGISPTGWQAAVHEGRMKARQPTGFFENSNVLGSFMLLATAAVGASVAGSRFRWLGRRVPGLAGEPSDVPNRVQVDARSATRPERQSLRTACRHRAAGILLIAGGALAIWCLCILVLAGSLGAVIGFVSVVVTIAAALWLRNRPKWLAAVLAGILVFLQGTLVGLGLNASRLQAALAASGGKAESLAFRLNYWEGASRLFIAHPLSGVGPGQFFKAYLGIKQPYAAEEVSHAHNWLLNQAAEWGALGVIGLLLAICIAGWLIVRSLAWSRELIDSQWLWPACAAALVIGVSWLIAAPGRSNAGAVLVSLVAAAGAIVADSPGRAGRVVLLAGLVGFCVHGAVTLSPGVPGATWPFWAVVVLAVAWGGGPADTTATASRPATAVTSVLVGLAGVAIVAMTVRPFQAVSFMNEAHGFLLAQKPEQALSLLERAAAVDLCDPAPLKVAAFIQHQIAEREKPQDLHHLWEAQRLSLQAVQRDPMSNTVWRNIAMLDMALARGTQDRGMVGEAMRAMQRSLSLYPNWPAGWSDLARIAAGSDTPDAWQTGISAADRALLLDDQWPAKDSQKFSSEMRAGLSQLHDRLQDRLKPASTQPPAL